MKKLNKKGFTLIEMLVVIAVIAILVAIIIPTVTNSSTKAKAAVNAANLRSVKAEIVTEMLANGSTDLNALVTSKANGVTFYTAAGVKKTDGSLIRAEGTDASFTIMCDNKTITEWADIAGSGSSTDSQT